MWYLISIVTFIALLWAFTQIGPGGQSNLMASNFFQGPGWFNAWRWVIVYVAVMFIVILIGATTNIHIMPQPTQPYHLPAGFYWWVYTMGLFVFIFIWRIRRLSYLQRGGRFFSNFRYMFSTYAIISMICVSLTVVTVKTIALGILGMRYGSEQAEEMFDKKIEQIKQDGTFQFR